MTNMETKQEIFDTVAKHLINQGCKSAIEDGGCLYRGPNGTKCAVGVLIPDEYYDKGMEGNSLFGLINSRNPVFALPEYFSKYESLLCSLQMCHDNANENDFTKSVKETLMDIGTNNYLNTAVLGETIDG